MGAINADLMTTTPYRLSQVGRAFFWSDLRDLIEHRRPDSALSRELEPETAPWLDGRKVAPLIAELFDAVVGMQYLFACSRGYKGPRPKRYPRPGAKDENRDEKHFGEGAIAIEDFEAWWNSNIEEGERQWQTE